MENLLKIETQLNVTSVRHKYILNPATLIMLTPKILSFLMNPDITTTAVKGFSQLQQ